MTDEKFSYKNCLIYLIQFDLEEAKANLRFAKQNRKLVKERLTEVMPDLSYYERYRDINDELPCEEYIYNHAKSEADDLVRAKLNLDREIVYDKAQIKKFKTILKARDAQ